MPQIRTGKHCALVLHAHLVFVTKYRHRVFTDRHLVRMEEIMREVCANFETELVEFNGENNHVHLLVNFPPKVAVSKLVNSLKGVSSRRLRQEFPDLVRHSAVTCGSEHFSESLHPRPQGRSTANSSGSPAA
ncbi:IS200/IS605 family transposase [Streptomyces longisporoflavus]|uniref:IS200/IS605 family transposase n=1 Tax=Streptomyces longisporoflavus TaxID=28044 RepID=A0ABW7QHT6_9ACTN